MLNSNDIKCIERAGLDVNIIESKLFTKCYVNFYKKTDNKYIAIFSRESCPISKKFMEIAKNCYMDTIEGLETFINNAPKKLVQLCSEFMFDEFMKYRDKTELYTHEHNSSALRGQAYTDFYPLTDLGKRLEWLGYKVDKPKDSGYYW